MQLDLNLLTALDALLEEGSVMGAADRLHLSPPAMSRTLGRIRRVTDDQILVRTGRTMTATPYALSVRADVHRLVQQAQVLLAPEHALDLPALQRTFTLQFHDAVTATIGADLLATTHAQAPGVRLRFLAEAGADTNDLRYGEVDLEVGATAPVLPEIRGETVAHDQLMVAVRANDPRRQLTLEQYAAADHLIVSRRGRLRDPVDDALESRGLRRRTIASAPTTTAALQFARGSDVLVNVPEHMSAALVAEHGRKLVPLPLEVPPIPLIMAWHQRYDGDRGHTWLRDHVREALRGVFSDRRGSADSG